MTDNATKTVAQPAKRSVLGAAFRAVRRPVKSVATLVGVTALCVSMLTAGAMALSASLFSLVSSAIEAVYDGRTVRKGNADALDRQNLEHQKKIAALDTKVGDAELKTRKTEQALLGKSADLEKLQAEQIVTFKGEKRALKEVVSETSAKVSKIAEKTAIRNVAVMPAEGFPIIGLTAIVAATTLEVASLCEISKEMYELEVAMNPGSKISDHPEACGVAVPTKADLIAMVQNSPSAAWDTAAAVIADLPTLEEAYNWLPTGEEIMDTAKSTGGAVEGFGSAVRDWWNDGEQN